jgi:hypothetical protein
MSPWFSRGGLKRPTLDGGSSNDLRIRDCFYIVVFSFSDYWFPWWCASSILIPNGVPSMLVSIFFFTQWTCPNLVMLCAIENDDLGFSVWGPCKNHRDRSYLMPFIAQSMASMAQTFIKNILSHSSVAPPVEANNLLSCGTSSTITPPWC